MKIKILTKSTCKEEIFICIEKKKLEQSVEIDIDNKQIMLVLSIIQKNIKRNSYIYQYVIIKSAVIHYLINTILIYILMMKWDI